MIQQVSSGSEMELQAKASEAMNNVMALYEQFGPPVLSSVEVCGDMLEFKCDECLNYGADGYKIVLERK